MDALLIKKAKSLIQEVKGKKISLADRKDRAIALAALIVEEAQRVQTVKERKEQSQIASFLHDPQGKAFIATITDQCFRSRQPHRIADQVSYIIKTLGIPSYLPASQRLSLRAFAAIGKSFSNITVPLIFHLIRKETKHVILPEEEKPLIDHLLKRRREGVRVNLNHLGEAILGEQEAKRRLNIYLEDLAKPEVEYISVKISTIYSQINLLAWEETLHSLADRLRQLYRTALKFRYIRPDGTSVPKFVNLDMEEYRDLHLTVALFRQVLDEAEFYQYEAGIVLQSYLPDSFIFQQELTLWAMRRLAQGGAPIKIRLVKGANLAMEQLESALHLWPQTPYPCKEDVDANYKRMITYGVEKEHAQAVHLGIGSHNIFDIAYALLLRAENDVEQEVGFEMLEGMADHFRRVVQQLSGDMLLYCPAAKKEEFQNAVAYLVRRLDENTAPQNFLYHSFDLKPETDEWNEQAQRFSDACFAMSQISYLPRRTQNRQTENHVICYKKVLENEPDTDWSLPQNRKWGEKILSDWKNKIHPPVPLVIGGKVVTSPGKSGIGEDPSHSGQMIYRYALATKLHIDQALDIAKTNEGSWSQSSIDKRMDLLANIANELRLHRADLIGAMVADTGKTITEADSEVSEAVDFAEYYRLNLAEWHQLPDIQWKSKGTILVAPPWNFPCSIPAGGMLAALATGNCIIFKPPPESILVGWHLVNLFWKGGINRNVLQFIVCEEDPVGSYLVKDPRLSAVILTGATATAKLFLRMRPDLDLIAETGGKNTIVITALADRDLAIKDLLQSAFGHAGQKCSACSLAILEKEVYDDLHFREQLRDAAQSLAVGSPWDLKTKMNPLIRPPNATLLKGLTYLENGEEWLLEPKQDRENNNLWSPGIKLGVTPSSFTFQNELFGPVLGLVRADSLEEAFAMMNQTPYGLTAGIQSLDPREQEAWLQRIEAGNCYMNRTITGAIVERQPFGGCKESSFGKGLKAGGPNYLVQMMQSEQKELPLERASPNEKVKSLYDAIKREHVDFDLSLWNVSIESYAFYWNEYFSKYHDPSLVMGQDNFQRYLPHPYIVIRGQIGDSITDLLRLIAAALTCETPFEISVEEETSFHQLSNLHLSHLLSIRNEINVIFANRMKKNNIKRVRMLRYPPFDVQTSLAEIACNLDVSHVMANGRLELLHFLREVSISRDYHRYGNLGLREKEKRTPLPGMIQKTQSCEDFRCHD